MSDEQSKESMQSMHSMEAMQSSNGDAPEGHLYMQTNELRNSVIDDHD
jgi:hypothetical protein